MVGQQAHASGQGKPPGLRVREHARREVGSQTCLRAPQDSVSVLILEHEEVEKRGVSPLPSIVGFSATVTQRDREV